MAKQRLNDKNLAKINRLTGRNYTQAWYRGGRGAYWRECWGPDDGVEMVNVRTGEIQRIIEPERVSW